MSKLALKKMNDQIEVDKEILSVLPKNNKKNLIAYKDKAAEIKRRYDTYLNEINMEIKRRVVKITSISPNPKIEETEKEIEGMKDIRILNEKITSFEKMELDEILFVLKRFYKNNLELVNESIVKCLERFKKVGIRLKSSDFSYSVYTKEYMKVFFSELKKGDINSTEVKENFEQIYWKCSDIIMQIELNFRSIYLKNEKEIDKYFENEKKLMTNEIGLNEKEAFQKYNALKSRLIRLKNKDTSVLVQKFINKEEATKDYEKNSINNIYKKILKDDLDDLEEEQIKELNKNISRLNDNLYEYKNFMNFKFIYDEIVEIFNSTEKYKNIYTQKLKQVNKLEAQLVKINKQMEKRQRHRGLIIRLFNNVKKNNNKLEDINTDVASKINELKEVYRELEENKVKNIISTELNKNSTIYDALNLISPFYSFLVDAIIKKYEDIQQDDIKSMIIEFREFIEFPKINIINNTKIVEDKDMALAIKDKYNLCNLNVAREDLEIENIDKLKFAVNTICTNKYLEGSKVDLDDIKYVLQATKVLEEDNDEGEAE